MSVSYARSTYEKSQKFNEKLNELQKTIDPRDIRTYLANSNREPHPSVELPLNLSDSEKAQLDELKALRADGIRGEMKYALAQDEKNGITLPENIVSGESIVPGFSQKVLNRVPSLGVYSLFMLFTEKELETYLAQFDSNSERLDTTQSAPAKPTQSDSQR